MTTYEPGSQNSPDRLDALVWALTDLMIGYECPMTFAAPPAGISRSEMYRQVEQSIFANTGTGIPYGSCEKPGGWSYGEGPAGGFDAQFSWSINGTHRKRPVPADDDEGPSEYERLCAAAEKGE
jgi:hypothetical protein